MAKGRGGGGVQNVDHVNHEEEQEVRNWIQRVPIGMNLCPWAIQSQSKHRIRYVNTDRSNGRIDDIEQLLVQEAKRLVQQQPPRKEPYHTTLIICPHVIEWQGNNNNGYELFDTWVKEQQMQLNTNPNYHQLHNRITLVTFHPQFKKWYDLPKGITVGSQVYCSSKGIPGVHKKEIFVTRDDNKKVGKNEKTSLLYYYKATIIETNSKMFGKRKVKIRYDHDDSDNEESDDDDDDDDECNNNTTTTTNNNRNNKKRFEQYVPVDWLVFPTFDDDDNKEEDHHKDTAATSTSTSTTTQQQPLLLIDNMMHRTPYPTIHLINNVDLVHLSLRDVSRVKRHNIQRMMNLERRKQQQDITVFDLTK